VLNRDVALKLLPPGSIDKVGRGHLLREAQTASSVSHPNIYAIHQVGQTGDDFYVVMELIEGRSLADLITATGPLDGNRLALRHARRMRWRMPTGAERRIAT
jgi:eukaryotic-like serine/threonine-protein kinase